MSKTIDKVREKIDKIIDKEIARTQNKLDEWYSRRADCGLRYLYKEEACEATIKELKDLKESYDAVARLKMEKRTMEDRISRKNILMLKAKDEISTVYGLEKAVKALQEAVDL